MEGLHQNKPKEDRETELTKRADFGLRKSSPLRGDANAANKIPDLGGAFGPPSSQCHSYMRTAKRRYM